MNIKYEIGLKCMIGDVVGRIVGHKEGCAMMGGEPSIIKFSTPHGTILESGRAYVKPITEEGIEILLAYENELINEGKELYAGLLSSEKNEPMNNEKEKEKVMILTLPLSRVANLESGLRTLVAKAEAMFNECERMHGPAEHSPLTKQAWETFCDLQIFERDFVNGQFEGVPEHIGEG